MFSVSPTRTTQPYRTSGGRMPGGALSAMLGGMAMGGGGLTGNGMGGTVPRVVGLMRASNATQADEMGRRVGYTGRSGFGRAPFGGPRTPMRAPRAYPRMMTPGMGFRSGGLRALASRKYTL